MFKGITGCVCLESLCVCVSHTLCACVSVTCVEGTQIFNHKV